MSGNRQPMNEMFANAVIACWLNSICGLIVGDWLIEFNSFPLMNFMKSIQSNQPQMKPAAMKYKNF